MPENIEKYGQQKNRTVHMNNGMTLVAPTSKSTRTSASASASTSRAIDISAQGLLHWEVMG